MAVAAIRRVSGIILDFNMLTWAKEVSLSNEKQQVLDGEEGIQSDSESKNSIIVGYLIFQVFGVAFIAGLSIFVDVIYAY
jgi:hypothetical protein